MLFFFGDVLHRPVRPHLLYKSVNRAKLSASVANGSMVICKKCRVLIPITIYAIDVGGRFVRHHNMVTFFTVVVVVVLLRKQFFPIELHFKLAITSTLNYILNSNIHSISVHTFC